MILFPNAKINIGLNITSRRPDGYHDIETIMVPVAWHDVLEIVPSASGRTTLTVTGRAVDCPPEKNLVMKAYRALADITGGLPPADIYLEKVIPDGAGIGGGSADAAFTLKGLNEVFNIGLPESKLAETAALIGADCPFFIYNRPAYCHGTGTEMEPTDIPALENTYIVIARPAEGSVSTRDAYAGVTPAAPLHNLRATAALPLSQWRGRLVNDFEQSIFPKLPETEHLKRYFYDNGAVYAAMTGSGSAVYGIFENANLAHSAKKSLTDCLTCLSPYPALNV